VLSNQVQLFAWADRQFGAPIALAGSAGSKKTKNLKETQDHGKSKDSEKGKEAGICEAADRSRTKPRVIALGSKRLGFAPKQS
jgi:hypothetical protein